MSVQGRGTTLFLGPQTQFDQFSPGPWTPVERYTDAAGETRGFVDDPLLGGARFNARDPVSSAPSLPNVAGQVDAALCLRGAGTLLRLLFGAPTTTGSAPNFTHVFKSGAATLPFASGMRRLGATDWRHLMGLMANTMTVRAEKTDGFPRFQVGLVGRSESAPQSAALSGTQNAPYTLLRPAASRPIVRWDGVAIAGALSWDLSWSNNLTPLNDLNGSEYPGGYDLGDAALTGSLGIRYAGSTWEVIAAAETYGALEAEWAMPGAQAATRAITFTTPRTKLIREGMPITGPGALLATYQWRGEQGVSESALVVTLKNDVASYA